MGKIFGIGLPKTGTSSLHCALQELGYQSVHYAHADGPHKGKIMIPRDMAEYDAASDLNIAGKFEQFDSMFPGSKFVYTVRELNAWLASISKALYYVGYWRGARTEPVFHHQKSSDHRTAYKLACHKALFGEPPRYFEREHFTQCYIEHERRVFEHFKNRKQDLFVFDVRDGWEPLCKFLGKRVPKKPFPKEEASEYHWRQGREKIPEGLLY